MATIANKSIVLGRNGAKVLKKAASQQVSAIKKGTKIQNVKKPGAKATAKSAKAFNGTKNKKAVQKPKGKPSTKKNTFDTSQYFDADAGPMGGFKGVISAKKGY